MKKTINVKTVTILGMLSAVAVLLTYAIHFPIFPSAGFLEYDPADVVVLLATFLFGPLYGVVLTVISSALQALTVSAQAGVIGFFMHAIATSVLSLVVGLIYRPKKTLGMALTALLCGTLAMAAVMVPLNLIFTPLYGVPLQAVKDMIFPVIIPFNLIKAGANSLIAFLTFRSAEKAFRQLMG